jgi:hypothetical protein
MRGQAIDELNHGVMAELEPLRESTDRRRLPALEPLHLEQQQILLRLDAGGTGGSLANPQEPANLVPQIRENCVVQAVMRSPDFRATGNHRDRVYHFTIQFYHLVICFPSGRPVAPRAVRL